MIFESSAEFLKKVGSNLVLIDRNIKYFPRGAWKILGNLPHFVAEPRSGEAQNEAEKREYSIVLRGWDIVRTWFWERFPVIESIR